MNRFYISTTSLDDWKSLLTQPQLQWKDGYSAKCLAEKWQQATGFPASVSAVFKEAGETFSLYANFVSLFHATAQMNKLVSVGLVNGSRLCFAWARE